MGNSPCKIVTLYNGTSNSVSLLLNHVGMLSIDELDGVVNK